MKHLLNTLTLFLLLAGVQHLQAQAGVTLHYYDGSQQAYDITESGKLYFDGDMLQIKTTSAATAISIPTLVIQKITLTESSTASTNDVTASSKLLLYPNPASATIQLAGINQATQVSIYSLSGQLLYKTVYNNGQSIDVSSFSSGIYIVKAGNKTLKFSKL